MPETHPYRDASLPVADRVADLLSRMTLEEKVGQMMQLSTKDFSEETLRTKHIGSYAFMLGEVAVQLQKLAEQSRLGIPLLSAIDAIHGHALWPGATVFPSQLAMSCSWDPEMVQEVARITAKEARATGAHWTFSPVLCVTRDLRWGRVDETFGEDIHLIGVLGEAMVRGYQGEETGDPDRLLACAKHYAGYSDTVGGRDASEASMGRRAMLSYYLPQFERACRAGCATYMTAYQSIDGLPCTLNRWLLTEVLKEQWGFGGIVVTDAGNLWYTYTRQFVCADDREAAERAVAAGNDIMNMSSGFFEHAVEGVKSGAIPQEAIDESCRRILTLKFQLGLFDDQRHPDLDRIPEVVGCAEHRRFALEAAYRSIVLLKNADGLLPLPGGLDRIAVIGPNADETFAQLGGWSLDHNDWEAAPEHPRELIVSVLDGVRARAGGGCRVDYSRGCSLLDPEDECIEEAAELARAADVALVVLGDNTRLYGELRDRAVLDLPGAQQRLLEAVHATGTPVVLVLVNGKPPTIPWAAENVPAIVEAWNPGMLGGEALAGLIWGDRNFEAKLTVSWARHVGQLPVYYNRLPGWHADRYADMTAEPLYPFGHGLSYTTFTYADLALDRAELHPGDGLTVSVDVTNAGEREGTEIVQVYVRDLVSSSTTPVKQLRGFARVVLAPGDTRTVRVELPNAAFAMVNQELQTVVEPGEFEIMVGPSSRDADLLRARVTAIG